MEKNIQGELALMDSLKIKPNYAALSREYKLDWRTVKRYHNGYTGKPPNRNKSSKLDSYKQEIIDKLEIRRVTVRGVYEVMVKKYGIFRIGTYSNFSKYVKRKKLRPKSASVGHPRYEKGPGQQAQVDWKEDIFVANKYGEAFQINILHVVLKFSRFSYLELSVQRRFEDVSRGLINAFRYFGGVPDELLFDNMSTVANINAKPKTPTSAITRMAKEFGFKVRLCRVRSAETKGTVEAKNKVIDWIRAYNGEFETMDELAFIVETINQDMNITINQETQMSPTALFYKEKEYLQKIPSNDILDTYLTPNKYTVSPDSLIRYGNCKYSVDPKLIGKEVTVDQLDNKLFIYYNGKLTTFHEINENPLKYYDTHYKELMRGKVEEKNLDTVVSENLEMMDKLLESRNIPVTGLEASKSLEALIAYINQSQYGKWIIGYFAHLSAADRLIFIRGMNEVLPYINDKEAFISNIKFSMKENICKNLAFDCLINDFMRSDGEYILTNEGFEFFKEKYAEQLQSFIDGINIEMEYVPDEDLPFI